MKLTNFLVILMLVILAVCAHAAPKKRGFPQFPGYGTFNPKGKLPVPFPKQRYRVASDQCKNKNFAGMWNTTQNQFEVVYSAIRKSWIASGERESHFWIFSFLAQLREKGIHNLSRTKQQIDPEKRVREA
uniref:Uncharacterized protein n=1 Tax=Vespula pensylvanica TaxID=30213 RepID=A0A834UBX2_VESPE|nr:hypothetical protein H0235_005772 [Vespula pensylvanica]